MHVKSTRCFFTLTCPIMPINGQIQQTQSENMIMRELGYRSIEDLNNEESPRCQQNGS